MPTHAATKNVFIAEDSAAVRARLVEMLGETRGVTIVGEAETPAEAVSGILRTHPDYVVLDFQLRGGTGADVLRALRRQLPRTVFIVMTNYPEPQILRLCLDAGADRFFDKSTEFSKIREVIAQTRAVDRPLPN